VNIPSRFEVIPASEWAGIHHELEMWGVLYGQAVVDKDCKRQYWLQKAFFQIENLD
jgi:hypothetical protein